MPIDASEAGHRLAELHGDYLFETGFEPELEGAQRIYVMLWRLQAEIYNGGIWQFFTNSTGAFVPYICDALRAVGADEMAEIMAKAVAASRPGTPWHAAAARSSLSWNAPDDVQKQADAFDMQLYPLMDDLSLKLFEFMSRHRNEFKVSEDFWEEESLQ